MAIPVITQEEWNKIKKQVDKYEHAILIADKYDNDQIHYRSSVHMNISNYLEFIVKLIKELLDHIENEEDIIKVKQYLLKGIMNIFNNQGDLK